MAKRGRKGDTVANEEPTRLRRSREEARKQLTAGVDSGAALLNRARQSSTPESRNNVKAEYDRWSARNLELLRQLFTDTNAAFSFDTAGPASVVFDAGDYEFGGPGSGITDILQHDTLRKSLEQKLNNLRSVLEQLDLYGEPPATQPETGTPPASSALASRKVFIVHGHDNALKQEVARLLERLKLEPIILHEMPNRGRLIFEKLEQHAAEVAFAVVLLTDDDLGEAKDKIATPKQRARQNVVLELGYFYGRIGRSKVFVLHRGVVDLPSDILGVVYTPYDGAWPLKLAREMKDAGLPVDMNLL